MRLKVVLIDDEIPGLQLLEHKLASRKDEVEIVGAYTDALRAIAGISSIPLDAIFVDIEMPGMNGLEFAAKITETNEDVSIVFITAYEQYALDAFRSNAVDYVLKPVSDTELDRVLQKLLRRAGRSRLGVHETLDPDSSKNTDAGIYFLGGMEVLPANAAEAIKWPADKVAECFAYFVCNRDVELNKWELSELLWPDFEPRKAIHNLYTAVYRLKKLMAEANFPLRISSNKGYYTVQLGECVVDFDTIEAISKHNIPVSEKNVAEYERAESLFRGEFLGGRNYTWAMGQMEKINQQYLQTALKLACYYISKNELVKGLTLTRKLERFFPYHEEIQHLCLQMYAAKKDKRALYKQYQTYHQKLQQDLGVQPTAQLTANFKRWYAELNK